MFMALYFDFVSIKRNAANSFVEDGGEIRSFFSANVVSWSLINYFIQVVLVVLSFDHH